MTDDRELHEAVRAAFACYDQDNNGCIDVTELRHVVTDLGGVLTDRDLRKALRILDRDSNGVIDQDEFTKWWAEQSEDNEAATGEVEKALMRIKELGRKKFRVDIHTASWNGFEDVVERLVENGSQLVNEKDATEFGNSNTPLHYAAYQGHRDVCRALVGVNVSYARLS
ncbi:hypothetical protein PHYBOEH_011953 [Phytophthora boehmeriae]|uniref:Calmodulin n=1 Tax=Phytophthora boehmeriae TaxID=109152 RepID=A0A8T1VDJ6_9STRA|nr:hypothetical protein PHYBOEH_011953 [Phytophthora boehmeriae]